MQSSFHRRKIRDLRPQSRRADQRQRRRHGRFANVHAWRSDWPPLRSSSSPTNPNDAKIWLQPTSAFQEQLQTLKDNLLSLASGKDPETLGCSAQELRASANSFVLRATQAALVAAKGGGYVQGHPVERWCREAMFFLVWSCPQPVLNSNLCEFAGIVE